MTCGNAVPTYTKRDVAKFVIISACVETVL